MLLLTLLYTLILDPYLKPFFASLFYLFSLRLYFMPLFCASILRHHFMAFFCPPNFTPLF